MIVLGIETSCDETSAAVVTAEKEILSHKILSQQEHRNFGGVVPEVAARAHLDHLDDLIGQAMGEAKTDFKNLDAIAVTAGPGLIGGVMVGVMTAKAIAAVHKKPLIAVNHLEGHALTVRLTENISFPYLLLLVSGGHCQILVVEGVGKYKKLGGTIDDALGEAFDKTAKLMGLGWPGGPAVEKLAAGCKNMTSAQEKFALPRAMTGRPNCDFSFSGLKTAVRAVLEKFPAEDKAGLCCAFQMTVGDIIIDRLKNAIKQTDCKTLVVAGGVAANQYLRGRLAALAHDKGMTFTAPPVKLCSDNAAMIAWAGIERLRLGLTDDPSFTPRPRWPLEELDGAA
jgi:N6-L-threonylcarbamoyladenine synthase